MNPQSRDTVTFLLTTFVSVCVVAGIIVRYVLMPYLRDHLVEPVKETHRQVTENHHASQEVPTLPDRLEDLHTDVRTLTRLLDLHVTWSLAEHNRIDRELQEYRRNGDTP